MAEFVVITGLSGAGRSQAGAALEDLGWYVMDNLPTALITKVADLVSTGGPEAQRNYGLRGSGYRSCSSRLRTRCWSDGSKGPGGATPSARRASWRR
jgi:hypothetical protein